MADEPNTPLNPPILTIAQVQKFLAAKRNQSCPSCGQNSWSVINPGDQHHGFLIFRLANRAATDARITSKPGPERVFAVWSAHCTNCGHISSYANHIVEKWIAEQGAP